MHGLVTRYLDRHDDVTIIELADHLHVTKQSASELVGALEAGGYVRRRPNPADRRSRFLELTAKGRQGLTRSRDRWRRIEAEWASTAGDDALATGAGRDGLVPELSGVRRPAADAASPRRRRSPQRRLDQGVSGRGWSSPSR